MRAIRYQINFMAYIAFNTLHPLFQAKKANLSSLFLLVLSPKVITFGDAKFLSLCHLFSYLMKEDLLCTERDDREREDLPCTERDYRQMPLFLFIPSFLPSTPSVHYFRLPFPQNGRKE